MKIEIAPSLLAADITQLGNQVKMIEETGTKWLHIDIMDGHFVPNLSYSPQHVKELRPISNMFFDVHLMLSEPEKYIDAFAKAGADLITVHAEAAGSIKKMKELAEQIHQHRIKAGISIKPKTSADVISDVLGDYDLILIMSVEPGFGGQSYIHDVNEKIRLCRQLADASNPHIDIEVDGGIKKDNIDIPVSYGANILVAGSSIFGAKNPKDAVRELKDIAERVAAK